MTKILEGGKDPKKPLKLFKSHPKRTKLEKPKKASAPVFTPAPGTPMKERTAQWGSEYLTSLVFEWSKRGSDTKWSGFQMPFEYRKN